MRLKTSYEWVAEPIDVHGDIIDPMFGDTFDEVLAMGLSFEDPDCFEVKYALVKNVGEEINGLAERAYAYLDETGHLPETFDNGDSIPKRYARSGLFRRIYL